MNKSNTWHQKYEPGTIVCMNRSYTITSKGQVTLPKALRDAVGLHAGGQASISLLDNRSIVIKAPLSVSEIRQTVGKPSGKQPLSVKERQNIKARGL